MTELIALIPCPLAIAGLALVLKRPGALTRAAAALMAVQMTIALLLWTPLIGAKESAVSTWNGFRPDSTAALFVLLTTIVAAAAMTHAVGFFGREEASEHP